MSNRRHICIAAIALGVVLLVVGALLWQRASDQQEKDRLAAGYERVILLDEGEVELAALVDVDPDAERTLPVVVLVVAGVLLVAGVAALSRQRT